ncbi:MAG: esterase/lipase family protein, partial [Bacillota bacterium]
MRPLLLVHGVSSNARHTYGTPGWLWKHPKKDSMFNFLLGRGYRPGQDLFWYSYPTLAPILSSARRLQTEIAGVQRISGSREVDLLAFSLGGIIGKYYLISPLYQNEIRKIIMIAPPFYGSRRADLCKTSFRKLNGDLLFPGDSHGLSVQILGAGHPLLLELAASPFPPGVKTTVIAMKIRLNERKGLDAWFQRRISAWIGEGDQTVAVESTNIAVDHRYIVEEDYSYRAEHGFLPRHPKIKEIVGRE